MKLVHIDLNQNLLENNFITEWIIESPEAFSEYVREIYLQCEGKDGRFVLSQNGKELDMSKYAEIIFNVYELDVNNRKILNKVYQGLEDLAYTEDFFVQTQEMNQYLQEYILKLEEKTDFILHLEQQIDLNFLFKGLSVELEGMGESLLEKLVDYVKTITTLLDKRLLVFVNLRSYLTDEQISLILNEMKYYQIQILFIENYARDCIEGARRCILDIDRCEI